MKLAHPDSKTTVECRADMADMYLSQGWRPVKERAEKPRTETPPAVPSGESKSRGKGKK